jgi:hypothetical protein
MPALRPVLGRTLITCSRITGTPCAILALVCKLMASRFLQTSPPRHGRVLHQVGNRNPRTVLDLDTRLPLAQQSTVFVDMVELGGILSSRCHFSTNTQRNAAMLQLHTAEPGWRGIYS